MKKVLLASTALVFAGGMAFAEVEVSGDGRMGIIGGGSDTLENAGPDGILGNADDISLVDESDVTFTSRVRFSFTGSGETDGGLTFGGSLASDDSGDDGTSGSVFAEGAFGKISMGDVDGAAKAAVGHVSGVGLTGLGDLNEMTYIANVGPDTPGVLYEYSFNDFTVYASADRPNAGEVEDDPLTAADETVAGDSEAYALGVSYGFGNYTVAAGYESLDAAGTDTDHWVLGATAALGAATVKATYGNASGAVDDDQWALSIDYVFGMTTVTAFYKENFGDTDAYGIGAAYDLGGGASLKGGIVDGDALDDPRYDFGLSMTF